MVPYRAKNPPERTPYFTYGLIAANVLAFLLTMDNPMAVSASAMQSFAYSNAEANPLRMLTAMFLHSDPFDLGMNMLFLWIFGQAVEGRMGPIRFLLLYFLSGIVGDCLEMITIGPAFPTAWNFGASAAIMGVAGAYLYMFPFATICVIYKSWFQFWGYTFSEWAAQWVVLYFLAFDVLWGVVFQRFGGVGHFANIGAAGVGFFLPMLLRMPRDSEDVSSAQAMRASVGSDYSMLALHELESLVQRNPGDTRILMAYCHKATFRSDTGGPARCMAVIRGNGDALLEHTDPDELARLILALPESGNPAPSSLLLRLGGKLETAGSYLTATNCYRRVYNDDPTGPDCQTALIRWARLTEQLDSDQRNAAALYIELLQKFPNGPQSMYAESALRRLGIERPRFAEQADEPTPKPGGDVDMPPTEPVGAAATDSGLATIVGMPSRSWSDNPPSAQSASSLEPAYHVGETRGMVLRPLGNPTEDAA